MRRLQLRHYWALIPIVAHTYWVAVDPPYKNSPPIRSDGLGYYSWTEAIVHGNFNFCQWRELVNLVHNPRHPERCMMSYTPGLALLRFPIMGPLAAIADRRQSGHLVVSSAEEKASLRLGALALVLECWLVLIAMRRLGVSPFVANVVALAGCFGTGLFHYGRVPRTRPASPGGSWSDRTRCSTYASAEQDALCAGGPWFRPFQPPPMNA